MKMPEFLLLVAGMAVVTYVPRWLPLAFLTGRQLPRWLTDWLELIPAAILGALLAPTLFASAEPRQLDLFRPELLAAIPTFLVAIKSRSLAGTVVAGMAAFWLVGKVLP